MSTVTIPTPAGPLTVLGSPTGEVLAAGFATDPEELRALVHPSLRDISGGADLGPVVDAVMSYLDGDLTAIDAVPVRQHSSGTFIGPAWQTMREIKPGEPVSYRGFATLAGRPAAVRAAAQACARNAAALFVPCHRVVRTDGSLGGYRWGLPVKRWLLAHESMLRIV